MRYCAVIFASKEQKITIEMANGVVLRSGHTSFSLGSEFEIGGKSRVVLLTLARN